MNDILFWYWVLMGVLLLVVLVVIFRSVRRSKFSSRTKKEVAGLLRKHGLLRQWKVYHDVSVGEDCPVDHLVIGPFGIIIACDLYRKGSYYGDLEKEEWLLAEGNEEETAQKSRIVSPLYQARKAEARVRELLGKNRIYNTPIDVFVPLTQDQPAFITGGSGILLRRKELKDTLDRVRYDKDNGVDMEAVAKALGLPEKS